MKKAIIITLVSCLAMQAQGQDEGKRNFWSKSTQKEETGQYTLPTDPATNKVSYTAIVETPGLTQKNLFERAKKWTLAKNTTANPYTISYESEEEGTLLGKGSFALPGERRKYVVQFNMKILTKNGKYKYEFTDLLIQYLVPATASGGGFAYFSSSSHKEAENLEYSIETFYPSRMTSNKPVIKFYEEINSKRLKMVHREMQSIAGSLQQAIGRKDDW